MLNQSRANARSWKHDGSTVVLLVHFLTRAVSEHATRLIVVPNRICLVKCGAGRLLAGRTIISRWF